MMLDTTIKKKYVLALRKLINIDLNNDKYSNYIGSKKNNISIISYRTDNYNIIPELIEHIKNEYYFPILNIIKLKDGYWEGSEWEDFQKKIFGDNYMPIEEIMMKIKKMKIYIRNLRSKKLLILKMDLIDYIMEYQDVVRVITLKTI